MALTSQRVKREGNLRFRCFLTVLNILVITCEVEGAFLGDSSNTHDEVLETSFLTAGLATVAEIVSEIKQVHRNYIDRDLLASLFKERGLNVGENLVDDLAEKLSEGVVALNRLLNNLKLVSPILHLEEEIKKVGLKVDDLEKNTESLDSKTLDELSTALNESEFQVNRKLYFEGSDVLKNKILLLGQNLKELRKRLESLELIRKTKEWIRKTKDWIGNTKCTAHQVAELLDDLEPYRNLLECRIGGTEDRLTLDELIVELNDLKENLERIRETKEWIRKTKDWIRHPKRAAHELTELLDELEPYRNLLEFWIGGTEDWSGLLNHELIVELDNLKENSKKRLERLKWICKTKDWIRKTKDWIRNPKCTVHFLTELLDDLEPFRNLLECRIGGTEDRLALDELIVEVNELKENVKQGWLLHVKRWYDTKASELETKTIELELDRFKEQVLEDESVWRNQDMQDETQLATSKNTFWCAFEKQRKLLRGAVPSDEDQ